MVTSDPFLPRSIPVALSSQGDFFSSSSISDFSSSRDFLYSTNAAVEEPTTNKTPTDPHISFRDIGIDVITLEY